jgi:hypothetical protein
MSGKAGHGQGAAPWEYVVDLMDALRRNIGETSQENTEGVGRTEGDADAHPR